MTLDTKLTSFCFQALQNTNSSSYKYEQNISSKLAPNNQTLKQKQVHFAQIHTLTSDHHSRTKTHHRHVITDTPISIFLTHTNPTTSSSISIPRHKTLIPTQYTCKKIKTWTHNQHHKNVPRIGELRVDIRD